MWLGISWGILMLNTSVQNLMCQSVTVTVQELSPTSLECPSFPSFSLVDSGTSRKLDVEREHTVQFFIQIQKDKPSEMVSRSFQSSFYMADQWINLSLTVEPAACLNSGNNATYGMNGLWFIFWTIGISKHCWEADLPSWAAGKLCPPAVPPSTANTHGCDCSSPGCVRVPRQSWELEVPRSHFFRLLQQVGSAWFSYQLAHCPEKLMKSWEGKCEWFPLSVQLY